MVVGVMVLGVVVGVIGAIVVGEMVMRRFRIEGCVRGM